MEGLLGGARAGARRQCAGPVLLGEDVILVELLTNTDENSGWLFIVVCFLSK